jgi:8-oxo-dGTP diphosphatase
MRGDGNGWLRSSTGQRFWGRFGAAGLLLWAPQPDGTPAILLQHRAIWCHHGGTWGLPRHSHETAEQAAIREAYEEAGVRSAQITVRATVMTAAPDGTHWTYVTVIADADELLATRACVESAELRWVDECDVANLRLHPGFAASWPQLRTLCYVTHQDRR